MHLAMCPTKEPGVADYAKIGPKASKLDTRAGELVLVEVQSIEVMVQSVWTNYINAILPVSTVLMNEPHELRECGRKYKIACNKDGQILKERSISIFLILAIKQLRCMSHQRPT